MQTITCIVCPKGCRIETEKAPDGSMRISGAGCKRGTKYALQEAISPTRTVTATVAIRGAVVPRLPVRSSTPVPKDKVLDAVAALRDIEVESPVKRGDVVARNAAGSGADFVATRDL